MPNIINRVGKYLQSGRSWYTRKASSIKAITVHHSAFPHSGKTDDQILDSFYSVHKGKNWPGLSYHFVIPESGKIYQINELTWTTWHDSSNYDSIGICLNGYFHPDHNNQPTKAQLDSLKWLLDNLCTQHPEFPAAQGDVYGHRDIGSTACPGNILYPYVTEYRNKKGEVSWEGNTMPEPTMEISKKVFEELVTNSGKWDGVVKYLNIEEDPNLVSLEKVKKVIAGFKSRITTLTDRLKEASEEEETLPKTDIEKKGLLDSLKELFKNIAKSIN